MVFNEHKPASASKRRLVSGRMVIDLTGQTFGKWTVLSLSKKESASGTTLWLCLCSCGIEQAIQSGNLRSGGTKGCKACMTKDMTGKVCGKWTVLRRDPNSKPTKLAWICRCSCGSEHAIPGNTLRAGTSTQCKKCSAIERGAWLHEHSPNIIHGASNDRQYYVWKLMRQRCNSPKSKQWKDYGGRGIKVCKRWEESYEAFLEDMGPTPPGMTIERTNNDGNYEPGNCEWIPKSQQRSNTRHTHPITFRGVTKPVLHWAKEIGISQLGLMYRLKKWGIERALTTPIDPQRQQTGREVAAANPGLLIKAARERWKTTPRVSIVKQSFKP